MRLWLCVMVLLATTIGCQSPSEKKEERERRREVERITQLKAHLYELEEFKQQLEQKRIEARAILADIERSRMEEIDRLRVDLQAVVDNFNKEVEKMRLDQAQGAAPSTPPPD